VETEIDIFVLR